MIYLKWYGMIGIVVGVVCTVVCHVIDHINNRPNTIGDVLIVLILASVLWPVVMLMGFTELMKVKI